MSHLSSRTAHPRGDDAPSDLDCIVVGYNDLDVAAVERTHRAMQAHSGGYRNFKANTIPFRGERKPLMHVLNAVIETATGADPALHVARLPNLGACYLTSYLRRRGLRTALINFFNAERDRFAELLNGRPPVVAITTTFYVDPAPIIDLVHFIRAHGVETTIVVGGPFVYNTCSRADLETQDFLFTHIGADAYVVDSQGEATLCAIVNAVKEGSDLASIPNLVIPDRHGGAHRSPRAAEKNDLNENIIDWSSFPPELYAPTVQMRTARSCAYKCSFCRYPVVAGALTLTDLDYVNRELRQLTQEGVRTVVFVDDTFNVPLPRFKDLCRMLIRNRFDLSWYSYFRCGNADDEAFDLMARSGCRGVFLGIESADPAVLRHMNKAATPERYRYGIRRLTEHGILTFASLIVGFPGETSESVARTAAFVDETAPTFFRAELYYHDPQTPIQQQAEAMRLHGAGYSWSHASMDWREASDHIDAMYASIRSSVVLPLYMFDFWSLPYLFGLGLTPERVIAFTKRAQRLLVAGLREQAADLRPLEQDLVELFRSDTHNVTC